MDHIEKKVGRFTVDVWTDGYPFWVSIEDDQGVKLKFLRPEDVRDLSYALDRVMAQIEPFEKKHS